MYNDRCRGVQSAEHFGGLQCFGKVVDVPVVLVPQSQFIDKVLTMAVERRFMAVVTPFFALVLRGLERPFSAFDGQQLLVVEASGVAGTPGV